MNGIKSAFVGRLPRDAGSIRQTANGDPMLGFSVAVSDGKRGDNIVTQWVRVTCFGDLAEELDGVLVKGDKVYCEGKIRLDVWRTPEGDDRPGLYMTAWTVQPLEKIGRQGPRCERRRRRQDDQVTRQAQPMPEVVAVGAHRDLRRELGLDDAALLDGVPF